ncbi:MAG: thiamine pyrophosphate-dependent dehydrogenase E1 component subunit alpha [Sandaracinaceae bacterium]|nr:thiamine pyrophosphate-dependent dehydrogenase E1 component subunit alpha [Sandaracinaceae bacterium]
MHELMVEGRALEERLIRMQRGGEGYFWIGGPGEEAFNTALGLLVHKGEGLDHDYLHLHYRSSATLLAMGADPVDALRQMRNTVTDPYSGGRNFVGHYSRRAWNLVPITSPIEIQYGQAIGTAVAQKRARPSGGSDADGITIVQGGDAGTAEGDFASCLIWAARPGFELPMLIIVTNNGWGISTPEHEQQGGEHIADRGAALGMKTMVIDGNDVESAYRGLESAMRYVRTERKPLVLEAYVSRLYGHSSSSGSNYVDSEIDCIVELEKKLAARGLRTGDECRAARERHEHRLLEAGKMVAVEQRPPGEAVWEHVFAERDHVGEHARKVPHDNRVWRAPACSFPTQKTKN